MNSLSTQQAAMGFMRHGRFLVACVFLAAMAGCAVMKPRTAEEEVRERAQIRWDALVKGDLKGAYALLSPGSRGALTFESYASSIRVGFWKSARVDKVICESHEKCQADVTIEYEFRAQRVKTPLRETWIREGTDWWYVQRF